MIKYIEESNRLYILFYFIFIVDIIITICMYLFEAQ